MMNNADARGPHTALGEHTFIRVLLVEDDKYYQRIVHYLLQGHSDCAFFVSKANNLAEAQAYLAKETPDVILLDLNLPDSRGLQTLSSVQSSIGRTPIVILTSSDGRELGIASIMNGATDFLIKQKTDADSLVRCIKYSMLKKSEESRMRLLAIEDFISTLAHDLQVPMIGENNVLDALIAGRLGPILPSQVEALTQLRESNSSQLSLVQKLIEIYRYESGNSALEFEKLDAEKKISECVHLVKNICKNRGIKIMVTIEPNLQKVLGDRAGVTQLLGGLIDNAVKYSDNDGTVFINAANDDHHVVIDIKNYGQVISDEEKTRLFQRFWTSVPGKKYVANTGLGLYFCHHIAIMHKAKITCKSNKVEGTTFSVTLPTKPVG